MSAELEYAREARKCAEKVLDWVIKEYPDLAEDESSDGIQWKK